MDGRKFLSDHGFWTRSQFRREPCAQTIVLSTVSKSIDRPPTICRIMSRSAITNARSVPRPFWAVLLFAAAGVTSIHATCGRLDDLASEETIRKALYASMPDFAELQRQLNRALVGRIPKALRRRPQRLAIDLTLIPYHGQPFHDPKEVYRSQAKCGTSHFHAYATAYVVCKGQRYTVALTTVAKGEPMKDVVQRLMRQARSVGIKPCLGCWTEGSTAWA